MFYVLTNKMAKHTKILRQIKKTSSGTFFRDKITLKPATFPSESLDSECITKNVFQSWPI
jgi:hypothetical protein